MNRLNPSQSGKAPLCQVSLPNSTVISWNSQGPPGPPGVTGGVGAGCLFVPPTGAADWHDCELVGVNVNGTNLTGANLHGAHLQTSNMSNVNLTGADVYGAQLTAVNLTGAILTGADFLNAQLNLVIWDSTICPDGTNSASYYPQTCIGHGI